MFKDIGGEGMLHHAPYYCIIITQQNCGECEWGGMDLDLGLLSLSRLSFLFVVQSFGSFVVTLHIYSLFGLTMVFNI